MGKRRTPEQIKQLLREAGRDLARGLTVPDLCRKVGVARAAYHRWRRRHGPDQADSDRRCRRPELEVERLKRLVAELLLDNQMLKEAARGNF